MNLNHLLVSDIDDLTPSTFLSRNFFSENSRGGQKYIFILSVQKLLYFLFSELIERNVTKRAFFVTTVANFRENNVI